MTLKANQETEAYEAKEDLLCQVIQGGVYLRIDSKTYRITNRDLMVIEEGSKFSLNTKKKPKPYDIDMGNVMLISVRR